jgi:hypothetical protein
MSINLSREHLNTLVDIISSLNGMSEISTREALLKNAFADYPDARRMLARINYGGDKIVFTTQMVTHLTTYGQIKANVESLEVLLQHIIDPQQGFIGGAERQQLEIIMETYGMSVPNTAVEKPDTDNSASASTSADGAANAPIIGNSIFLSYARSDGSDFADKLHDELEGDGYDVWFDRRDISSSAYWDDAIESALKECSALILVMTPGSTASQNCKDEWGYVLDAKKPVITLMVKDTEVPFRIRRVQWIDFRASFSQGIAKLRQRLRNK